MCFGLRILQSESAIGGGRPCRHARHDDVGLRESVEFSKFVKEQDVGVAWIAVTPDCSQTPFTGRVITWRATGIIWH